jgi:glycosyltransferase involved in cell wall biosynthesis
MVTQLARRQRELGHEVSIHTLGPPVEPTPAIDGLRIIESASGGLVTHLRRLRTTFSRTPPDVVHCHQIRPTIAAAPAARLAGVPAIVSTRHGLGMDSLRAAREFQYWLAARYCHAVVGVCKEASKRISEPCGAQPAKVITIPNGTAPAQRSPHGDLAPSKKGFSIVNVGKCSVVKDQQTLLRAFSLARRLAPDLHLWIVGDGPLLEELRRSAQDLGIAEQVFFAGVQRYVGDWLASADLFVLCSESEGLPLALLEAAAAGLPAVVTDVGGMPDVVRACGAGRIVPAKDPKALCDALLDCAQNRGALSSMSGSIRERYERDYTPDRMVRCYGELYERFALTA